MRRMVSLAIVVLFLSGCVTMSSPPPEPSHPIQKSMVFDSSYENVWKAMVRTFTASGEVVSFMDKANGIISFNKEISFSRVKEIAVMPRGLVDFSKKPAIHANIIATKIDETHTEIVVNITIVGGFYKAFTNFNSPELYSNGILEKEYLDVMKERLSSGK